MSVPSDDPIGFLMKISPPMLIEYGKHHNVTLDLAGDLETGEKCARLVMSQIEKESETAQGEFVTDFDDIDAMAKEEVCNRLANELLAKHTPLNEKTVEMFQNWTQWSMYFYVNHYELFYQTFDDCALDMKQGWKGRMTVSVPFDTFKKNLNDFKKALKQFYSKEYKGKKVNVWWRDKQDRVIFTAHVQGNFRVEKEFEQGSEDLKNQKPWKPVFPINFLYRPDEGILEVKAKGGKARVRELQHLFIEHFLKADPSKLEDMSRFDFEKAQNLAALTFPVTIQDGVENVLLKGVKMKHIETGMMLSLDVDQNVGIGVEPMVAALAARNIPEEAMKEFEVEQYRVRVLFNPPLKGRQRSVTVTITNPDGCNLKQRDVDMVVYNLLKRWGLIFF